MTAVLASLTSLALWACLNVAGCDAVESKSAPETVESPAPVAVSVTVSESIEAPVMRHLVATGTLNADEETIVAAKVAGRIDETYADLGDEVEVGALLAQIDPVDAELALTERRLALAEALTQLGIETIEEIDEAFLDRLPEVQRARHHADNTKARLDRADILLHQSPPLISAQDHADLRTVWEIAEQDHRLSLLTARATLARARTLTAQVASAKRLLDETRVIAPTGLTPPLPAHSAALLGEAAGAEWDRTRQWSVAERYVGSGSFVQPGTPLFRLVDVDPLKLRVSIPEHRVRQVSPGAQARVRGEGAVNASRGWVVRIAPIVDPATRTFDAEILVPNADRSLRPGGFARAEIRIAGEERAVLVPVDGLIVFAGIEKVFVVVGNAAEERRVETGARFGELVEIVSGVDRGDMVIRSPSGSLLSGTPVTIAERSAITPPEMEHGG